MLKLAQPTIAVTLLLGLSACGDAEVILAALGDGCVLDSDCNSGLVCVYRRCHEECNQTPDCPIDDEGQNLHCMLGEKPDHYCQLQDERDCSYSSECPGSQLCGPDGRCRDECISDKDCVADQTCTQRACALPSELDDNGQLPVDPALPGAGFGSYCEFTSECASIDPDFICRIGVCNFECRADADCETGLCNIGEGKEGGRCAASVVVCVPGKQVACACLVGNGVQVCDAAGAAYGPCENNTGDCNP